MSHVVVDDILCYGFNQVIFIHDDDNWESCLSRCSMLIDGSRTVRHGKIVHNDCMGSKRRHLYSVLRAVKSREEAGCDELHRLRQMVCNINGCL